MRNAHHACVHAWSCCPSWFRLFSVFVVANILGDLAAFPLVHSFWNLVGFEGWFM